VSLVRRYVLRQVGKTLRRNSIVVDKVSIRIPRELEVSKAIADVVITLLKIRLI